MNSETRIILLHALDELNKQVEANSYECPDGCHKCCGPVAMTRIEADRIGIDRQYTLGVGKHGDTCEFVGEDGKCRIYNMRPFICRFFNSTWAGHFKCNEIPGNGLIAPGRADKLLEAYFSIISQEGAESFMAASDVTYDAMKAREERNGWGSRFSGVPKRNT